MNEVRNKLQIQFTSHYDDSETSGKTKNVLAKKFFYGKIFIIGRFFGNRTWQKILSATLKLVVYNNSKTLLMRP